MKGGRANELENGRNGRTVVAVHQIFFTLSRPPFFSIPPSLVYTVTLSLFFFYLCLCSVFHAQKQSISSEYALLALILDISYTNFFPTFLRKRRE